MARLTEEQLAQAAAVVQSEPPPPVPSVDEVAVFARTVLNRRNWGINLIRPLPYLEDFFECRTMWRIIGGGNRSSKTASCLIESVRQSSGVDPYDKYVKKDGRGIIVARKEDELAAIFGKMTEPGLFWVIPDEHTKQWRAVRPDPEDHSRLDPYDEAYREKWRPGPPLLKISRDIKGGARGIAWESSSKRVPRWFVNAHTGNRMDFRSSNGQPDQGMHYTFGWIDEQLQKNEFYEEINRGLLQLAHIPDKHMPKGIWSATEQTTNLQLDDLREAAARKEPHVSAFMADVRKNPFIKQSSVETWSHSLTADERRFRLDGQSRIGDFAVYRHHFDIQGEQGCEPFEIPDDYCRYVAFDPGTRHCGILFGAVDPHGQYLYIYDGIDVIDCAPSLFAEEVVRRQGNSKFEAIIVDHRMGRQRTVGQEKGRNAALPYAEALEEKEVKVRTKGSFCGMHPGCDDLSLRQVRLQQAMDIRENGPFAGTAKLKVFRGVLPELEDQIRRAHLNDKTHKRNRTIRSDLLDCLEYMAAFDPEYYPPEMLKVQNIEMSKSEALWEEIQEQQRQPRRRRRY